MSDASPTPPVDAERREQIAWQAIGELKGAIRPLLDAAEFSEHAEIRKAFNHAATLAGERLDIIQDRSLPAVAGRREQIARIIDPDWFDFPENLAALHSVIIAGRQTKIFAKADEIIAALALPTPTQEIVAAEREALLGCSECGGTGTIYHIEPDCCGNLTSGGECRSYCVVPRQVPDACPCTAYPMKETERSKALRDATDHLPPLTQMGETWFWSDDEIRLLRLACAKRFGETLRTESLFAIAAIAIRLAKTRGAV